VLSKTRSPQDLNPKLWTLPSPVVLILVVASLSACRDRDSAPHHPDPAVTNATLFPTLISQQPNVPSSPSTENLNELTAKPALDTSEQDLREAFDLNAQGRHEDALKEIDSVLAKSPTNINAYNLRGKIHTDMKLWNEARQDFEAILQIDGKNVPSQFNLSELKFMQKQYADARPGFLALESDGDWGDLASYRVFLCDLLGGQEDMARKELDAFDVVGAKPSYFFGNVAWQVVHRRPEDARSWLNQAEQIYEPQRAHLYLSSLEELGYLPLSPP